MPSALDNLTTQQKSEFLASIPTARMKETIYMIESPSPDDLFSGRNEGDALARTLNLAEISVIYYLGVSEEKFQDAFDDISIRINSDLGKYEMPFLHISAHGYDQGLELTDGGTIYWGQLTRKLVQLSDIIGRLPFAGEIPRINLSLSSCSAFKNYADIVKNERAVQLLLGPTRDIGWCEALIGFTTFFYQTFILHKSYYKAAEIMNAATADTDQDLFALQPNFDANLLRDQILNEMVKNFLRKD